MFTTPARNLSRSKCTARDIDIHIWSAEQPALVDPSAPQTADHTYIHPARRGTTATADGSELI
jgi:hypothetical protein